MHTDPQMTLNRFNGTDYRVIEQVKFISRLKGASSRSGARYACCSQRWIASKIGVCRETVNRSVRKLVRLGVLRVVHRRRVAGHWSTNITVCLQWINWGAARVTESLRQVAHRVSKFPRKDLLQEKSIIKDSGPRPSEEERGRLTALLSDLADRFKPK